MPREPAYGIVPPLTHTTLTRQVQRVGLQFTSMGNAERSGSAHPGLSRLPTWYPRFSGSERPSNMSFTFPPTTFLLNFRLPVRDGASTRTTTRKPPILSCTRRSPSTASNVLSYHSKARQTPMPADAIQPSQGVDAQTPDGQRHSPPHRLPTTLSTPLWRSLGTSPEFTIIFLVDNVHPGSGRLRFSQYDKSASSPAAASGALSTPIALIDTTINILHYHFTGANATS